MVRGRSASRRGENRVRLKRKCSMCRSPSRKRRQSLPKKKDTCRNEKSRQRREEGFKFSRRAASRCRSSCCRRNSHSKTTSSSGRSPSMITCASPTSFSKDSTSSNSMRLETWSARPSSLPDFSQKTTLSSSRSTFPEQSKSRKPSAGSKK